MAVFAIGLGTLTPTVIRGGIEVTLKDWEKLTGSKENFDPDLMASVDYALGQERRYKQISMTPELILSLLLRTEEFDFPDEVRALRCGLDQYGNIVMLVESSSFDPVHPTAEIPYIEHKSHETTQSHS